MYCTDRLPVVESCLPVVFIVQSFLLVFCTVHSCLPVVSTVKICLLVLYCNELITCTAKITVILTFGHMSGLQPKQPLTDLSLELCCLIQSPEPDLSVESGRVVHVLWGSI